MVSLHIVAPKSNRFSVLRIFQESPLKILLHYFTNTLSPFLSTLSQKLLGAQVHAFIDINFKLLMTQYNT